MIHIVMAFLPLAVLLVLALVTKKMTLSMMTATMLALVLLNKQHFVTGTLDAFYATLSNSSYQFCLMLVVAFGAMIELFQQSGGVEGFAKLMGRFVRGRKSSLVICWIMSVVLFADEYLNALTVTFSMREITDKYRVPREHLAFQAHAMACSLCMTVPLTSWTAFTISLIGEHGLTFDDYIKAIPLMFYPNLSIILCLLLAVGLFPKIGLLKGAYKRVDQGHPAFLKNSKEESLVDIEMPTDVEITSALNTIIPILVLIVGTLVFGKDLLAGLLLALIVQFAMYVFQKIMTVSDYFKYFLNGAKGMTSIAIILAFGFTLSQANQDLGMFDIIIGGLGDTLPPQLLPVLAFILVGFTVFAVGGCWVVMLIAIPIFLSIAVATGADPVLTLGAIMSGIGIGFSTCFYADTVFMTTAGTGVGNIAMIVATAPYALIMGVITAGAYLVFGYM